MSEEEKVEEESTTEQLKKQGITLDFPLEWKFTERELETVRDFNSIYYMRGNFTWGATSYRGVKVWEPPTDLWVWQELIYEHRPKLIIECGTGPGGTALWFGDLMKKAVPDGKVVTIDVEDKQIFPFVKELWAETGNIEFLHGSSTSEEVFARVKELADAVDGDVLVLLDSWHYGPHVLKELEMYSKIVADNHYIIVSDTMIPGPRGAVTAFLQNHNEWSQDVRLEKYILSFSSGGFLIKAPKCPDLILTVALRVVLDDTPWDSNAPCTSTIDAKMWEKNGGLVLEECETPYKKTDE